MNLYTDTFNPSSKSTPVLMVHGLGATSNVWGAQAAALSRFFPVYCPDNRSSGRSALAESASIADMVGDLVELMDQHKLASAHLIGHSLGSVVVQHLATLHPERARSVALIGPIYALPEPARVAMRERAEAVRSQGLSALATATAQGGTSAETKAARPEIAAFVRELVMAQNANGYAQICGAVAEIQPAAIENLRCPALVITGDEDTTAPPAAAQMIARKIPGARLELISRCGHWTPIEKAAAVSELLLKFVLENP